MAEKNRKIYWVLPRSVEKKSFDRFDKVTETASIQSLAYDLIKGQSREGDLIIITPVGELIYRPRINQAGEQMTKRFNATKTFCTKLLPKVTRKLFPDGNIPEYDFTQIDHILDFMKRIVESGVVLGVVGQEGKKGILKRVSPISPLKEVQNSNSLLMEAYDVYSTVESLFNKIGMIENDLIRETEYDELQILLG